MKTINKTANGELHEMILQVIITMIDNVPLVHDGNADSDHEDFELSDFFDSTRREEYYRAR